MSDDGLTRRMAELTGTLLEEQSLDVMLRRVSDLFVAIIPACDAAGVTLGRDGRVSTYGATDSIAERLDSYQYETGQGPCLEAVRTGEPFAIRSFETETRWPRYTPRARAEGAVSSLSLPLGTAAGVAGALNMYALTPAQTFSDDDFAVADRCAAQAAVVLRNAYTYHRTRDLVDELQEAVASRDVIGQAKGILMAHVRCGADEAFHMLRRESQQRNIKLRQVAEEVIERTTKGSRP
jgi:GAF domain-containing protein